MANSRGIRERPAPEQLAEFAKLYLATGCNVSETSRRMQRARSTLKHWLKYAQEAGLLGEEDLRAPNTPKRDQYLSAAARMKATYQAKKRRGDWRKPVATTLPARPFRLKVFGDPHLDADGCDFELFERHWLEMDAANGVYGVCVGDWFNNWLRVLGHLWKEERTDPADAWLVLVYLMEQRGDALIAACSGNHDDWTHGPVDPVDELMKRHGVLYRKGAIRVMVNFKDCAPMFWAIRHKWKGSSMYSAAHWGVRANREGWRDALLIGGHIHQDDTRLVAHADGFKSHVVQVSAFKEFDDYADIHGFNGQRISPVWDLVIDPLRDETDPDRIKVFWSSEAAAKYHAALLAE